MGPLGWQETIAIFVIALLLFGPKKLPQLGKDLAKAMGEFKRATSDLKGTWDREMAAVERETGVAETARQIDRELSSATIDDTYHGTSSSYDSGYDYGHGVDQAAALSASTLEGTAAGSGTDIHPSTDGATATQGAETTVAELVPPSEATNAGHPPVEAHEDAVPSVAETIPRVKTAAPSVNSDGPAHS